jgi:ribokinase
MDKKIDLLTIGDVSVDLYMRIADKAVNEDLSDPQHPKVCFLHGTKIPVDDFESSIAGNALNVAFAAQTLGITSEIYTETGDDENTKKLINELKQIGVTTRLIKRNTGTQTDVHAIIVFSGERTIFSYHGKRNYSLQEWGEPKFIYYTSIGKGFEEFQKEFVKYLKDNPQIGVVFNPGTFQLKAGKDHLLPVLEVTDVIILNKEEAEELTDIKDNSIDTHKGLQKLGPKLTIITDGANDVTAYDGLVFYKQRAYNDDRPIVDKTGAGDAFASAFVSALIYGKSIQDCLKWGVIDANSQIKVIGSTQGLLNKRDIEIIAAKI